MRLSVVPAEFVRANTQSELISTISAVLNFTVSWMAAKTASYALRTSAKPTADGLYGGIKTPSWAYNGITALQQQPARSQSYFITLDVKQLLSSSIKREEPDE